MLLIKRGCEVFPTSHTRRLEFSICQIYSFDSLSCFDLDIIDKIYSLMNHSSLVIRVRPHNFYKNNLKPQLFFK